MYSQFFAVALHFIPIIGGVAAGIISVGAIVVDGLSVKDIADYIFGLGSSLSDEEILSLADRKLGKAVSALNDQSISMMDTLRSSCKNPLMLNGVLVENARTVEFMLFRDRICKLMQDNGLNGALLQDIMTMQRALSPDAEARLKNILGTLSKASQPKL